MAYSNCSQEREERKQNNRMRETNSIVIIE